MANQPEHYPRYTKPDSQSIGCNPFPNRKRYLVAAGILAAIVGLTLGLVLGLGHHSKKHSASSSASVTPSAQTAPPIANSSSLQARNGTIWQPAVGSTWQIELENPFDDITLDVQVFDFDLFNNTAETISALHSKGRNVICYFSAGSYEEWSPDQGKFNKTTDLGNTLQGWPGEWWLNLKSENVRDVMLDRLDLAVEKGCDGVDPDNIDAYDNDNGLGLTDQDSIDYVNFLADAANDRNLSIGLKNAGDIIDQVLSKMQWSVNEQCVENEECDLFDPFIANGKPVFHIEYPNHAPKITDQDKDTYCNGANTTGFSTLLKQMDLDDWVYACP